ncbi:hypothetical protein jhhlp_000328 [Lomentospora prolificans]|uniref:Heterokaryon incompatibility domain-containing protein n=1 Tax=Lomentospora prolificans TaxID=41688 RepID=A0A2N3NKL8_9PEZI|nr:hypothetical protein jhhlp_000328 [Lomentospora prolificans]
MHQASSPFDYSQIPVSGRQIRVFTLLPASAGDQGRICGQLFVTDLDELCEFMALSYAWGSNDATGELDIDGQYLPITPALEIALRGLRRKQPLDIWIDQICINQQDLQEKALQIPLMKDIYTLSSQTIAWLGDAVPSTGNAIAYLDRLGKQFSSFGIRAVTKQLQEQLVADEETEAEGLVAIPEHLREVKKKILEMIDAEGEWDKLDALPDLDEFFDAPYFTRGWIKQEVSLPPKLLFQRGEYTIDGDILYAGLQFHIRHWQHESKRTKTVPGEPLNPELKKKFEVMLADRPGRDAANASLVARVKLHNSTDEPPATLGKLIRRFRLRPSYTVGRDNEDATMFSDPKDHVYGLLGLASDSETLDIPIRTSKDVTPEEVYVDATRRIIGAGDIDFLFLAHRTEPHAALPSWVADFRAVCSIPHLTFRTISSVKPFSASASRTQSVRPAEMDLVNPMILPLEGIQIEVIGKLGDIWPAEAHGDRSLRRALPAMASLQVLIQEAGEIVKSTPNHPLCTTQEQKAYWEQAPWRVPIADHEYVGNTRWHSQRATAERSEAAAFQLGELLLIYHRLYVLGESPEVVLPFTEEEKKALEGLDEVEQEVRKLEIQKGKLQPAGELRTNYASSLCVSEVRRGFLGSQGFVGIGPLEMCPGDVICVLFGATLPVVLRPLQGGLHSYVGDVYCHGVMDGEVLAWGRESHWFKIR